ncbi:MAG TPA: ABC-2 family transporter protein [Candidatus Bathyarchaeia archaeon]|nr:ABC-2 family transporter protein [Candidatus Bathyarchaeia archaeon]
MNLKKYFYLWCRTTILSLQSKLSRRGSSVIFILGKFVRFTFYIFSLLVVLGKSQKIAGFDIKQMINFFLIFNLFDLLGQFFFRGIYWFRGKIISGMFDLSLIKPVNPLFQVLITDTDLLDLPLLLMVIAMLIKQNLNISLVNLTLFILVSIAAFIVVTSLHILIVSIGIITTEVDNTAWIYRDLSLLARVPVDIYLGSVRAFLTFVLPLAVIFTFPAKAMMGILSWSWIIYSLIFSSCILFFALNFWRFALKKYSSASS